MIFESTFTSGVMNSDIAYSLGSNKSYVKAVNFRISGKGKDGIMHNIKGHSLVSSALTDEGMVIVGAYEGRDDLLYFFLAHSNGKSKIISYNVITHQSKLIIGDNTVLRFDLIRWKNGVEIVPYRYILSINQIGDLLIISNEAWKYPRVINLNRTADYASGFTEEDINLIKKPPKDAPQFVSYNLDTNDNDGKENEKFVSFCYRYKYIDGDFSSLSFFSETAFQPKPTSQVNVNRDNNGMSNYIKDIKLSINSGNKNVTDIEVYAREHGSNTAYMIYSANKKIAGIGNDIIISNIEYKFSNHYEVLDEATTQLLYSRVPHYPKAQDVAGNRIIFGNFKEDFDLIDSAGNPLNINFKIKNNKTTFAASQSRKTAVSLLRYKAAVHFYNDYNESTTALLPVDQNNAEIEIPFEDRLYNNNLRIEMLSMPPKGFTKMKFSIKSEDLNYNVLYITYLEMIGTKVYLSLKGDNVNRIKKGDVIIRTDTLADKYREYYVTNIKEYTHNDGLIVEGLYAEIEVEGGFVIEGNGASNVIKNYKMWDGDAGGVIDSVKGSTNPRRFDATSGYTGNGMDGHFYNSAFNRGRLWKSDFGNIYEGDFVKITIRFKYSYDKFGRGSGYTPDDQGSIYVSKNMYASKNYDNLYQLMQEQFIYAYLNMWENGNEIGFMTNSEFPQIVSASGIAAWNTPPSETSTGRNRRLLVNVYTDVEIKRGKRPLLFRTKNLEALNNFYYETEKTYSIVNGQYIPDGTSGGNPYFDIGFYNGYCWGNGLESYRIKDKFNEKKLHYKFRASLYDKKGYKEIHKTTDLTYSGIYNYDLGINELSVFNPTLVNWKELPINYGSIQRIISTDGDITVFLEDKVINQYYGKSVIMDLQGNENVGISKEVLGNHIVLPYEFGIATYPESVAKFANFVYFTDQKRKRILVKMGNEIQEINGQASGMYNDTIELLKDPKSLLGSFDESNNEYVLGIDHKLILGFNPFNKGYTSFYTYNFDYLKGGYGKSFTAYKGIIYQNEGSDAKEDYNKFAGQGFFDSEIKFIVNPEMQSDKVFQAMYLKSNTSWNTTIRTNLTSTKFPENIYQKQESFYYSDILRDSESDYGMTGIGTVQKISGNIISLKNNVSNMIYIGDVLINELSSVSSKITSISGNTLTVENISGFSVGDYILAKQLQVGSVRPNGVPIRGEWMEVTLSKPGGLPYYLAAVYTEVKQSK
ncbi:hypothetical protein [uncultured Chryseobacterium sp.]|uniref:hypothetical protein n=1 Tax=uncultured Chryseobacterium sp. TaxID=259322 RepID=UPI0025EC2EA8|nr:hypothetical protein [uncultured Chryseobacterium sp.]